VKLVLGLVALVPALTTCVAVTHERALRDMEVGKASTTAATFEVEGGLAAVRRLEPGIFSIWAQSPVVKVRVRTSAGAAETWTVTIENTLPDATLDAASASGETIVPIALDAARITEKRWRLSLPPGTDATLTLHPPTEPTGSWRFALLSDIQEAIDRVQDIYARMNSDPAIQFVVSAGDLTTRGGVDQLVRFQHELESLRVPYFTTLGNHELGTDDGMPFQTYFGRSSFRFLYGGIQFTFIDSGSATLDPMVYDWLTGWIDEGRNRTHVVLMHIPPIDPIGVRNGSFADRNEAAKLLATLAEGNVDLTLYGHIHSYYSFSNAGIPAYISGGGGSIPERFDGIGRHYLTVDVDPKGGVLQTALVRIDGD
jgi:Icc-related predicted phosphoesterase